MFRSVPPYLFASIVALLLCPTVLAEWNIGEPAGSLGDPTIMNTPQGSFQCQGEGPANSFATLAQYEKISGSMWDFYGYTRYSSQHQPGEIHTEGDAIWYSTAFPDPDDGNYPVDDYKLEIIGEDIARFDVRNP